MDGAGRGLVAKAALETSSLQTTNAEADASARMRPVVKTTSPQLATSSKGRPFDGVTIHVSLFGELVPSLPMERMGARSRIYLEYDVGAGTFEVVGTSGSCVAIMDMYVNAMSPHRSTSTSQRADFDPRRMTAHVLTTTRKPAELRYDLYVDDVLDGTYMLRNVATQRMHGRVVLRQPPFMN